jgi:integrase
MKAGKEHVIPLSSAAVAVLRKMEACRMGKLVFPGVKEGKPCSDMTLTAVLRRMKRGDLTAHGFRSTFRDWAAEATAYPAEMAEMALAHTIGDKTERAYRRGDLFQKRVRMMNDWARWCAKPLESGEVVPLRAKRSTTAPAR